MLTSHIAVLVLQHQTAKGDSQMALTFTPYRFYGLRSSFRTKYRISEGYAEILKLRPSGWLVVQRLPLEDISTKIEDTKPQKLLGRGSIKITTVSGESMMWENLIDTKVVQDALYHWKTLDVPDSSGFQRTSLGQKWKKGIKEQLVHLGLFKVDDPDEYPLTYYSRFPEMRRQRSITNCQSPRTRRIAPPPSLFGKLCW